MQQDALKNSSYDNSKKYEVAHVNQEENGFSASDEMLDVKNDNNPYGPWMIVKRQPRKKTDKSSRKINNKSSIKQFTEDGNGSRFYILQNKEQEEDNQKVQSGKAVAS
ncbi:hypothetical protein SESBI_24825 [Sesbania bispinosa]|nr:hypothetical protein SESBI_24825 [Sesbania bispinosa]